MYLLCCIIVNDLLYVQDFKQWFAAGGGSPTSRKVVRAIVPPPVELPAQLSLSEARTISGLDKTSALAIHEGWSTSTSVYLSFGHIGQNFTTSVTEACAKRPGLPQACGCS